MKNEHILCTYLHFTDTSTLTSLTAPAGTAMMARSMPRSGISYTLWYDRIPKMFALLRAFTG